MAKFDDIRGEKGPSLILVTGAPGWVGTRLVQTLLPGPGTATRSVELGGQDAVRCLVVPQADASLLGASDQLDVIRGDLRNLEDVRAFCRGAEGATLFHCAGIIHPSIFVRELMQSNVVGTRNLLRAAREAGVRRVVALSSNSVAGMNARREARFDEASPYHPDMGYGRSKMLMERDILEARGRGTLETVILRPTWFYGPGQPERQTSFFRMIRNGTVPIVGDGENLRSLTYVDSLCQAMHRSARSPQADGKTYWFADRRPYSMNEIVDTIERLMETEFGLRVAHRRMRLPHPAADLAHFADVCLQTLGLYDARVHVLSQMDKTIACSVALAEQELGYAPIDDLADGMRRSLSWLVAQGIPL